MAPHTFKLTYFDFRGRGEPIRIILNYVKQPFLDNRIQRDQWPSIKPTTPFGQIPVLEVDGIEIAQTVAIMRFIGRSFALAGKDNIEAAQLDAIADTFKDFQSEMFEYFLVAIGFKEGNKEALYKEKMVPAVEKHFPVFDRILSKAGSGFFGRSGISWVDFFIADFLTTVMKYGSDSLVNKYSHMKSFYERVHSLPPLKQYFKNRKDTF
uniref:glutathione transferase n=1 Tax=Ditylenchus dipsaci TaxID=166011 RepID=A0A915CSF2_9BILA